MLSETVDTIGARTREGIAGAMALTDHDLAQAAEDVPQCQDEDLFPCWASLMRLQQLQAQLRLPQASLDAPLQSLVQASQPCCSYPACAVLYACFERTGCKSNLGHSLFSQSGLHVQMTSAAKGITCTDRVSALGVQDRDYTVRGAYKSLVELLAEATICRMACCRHCIC